MNFQSTSGNKFTLNVGVQIDSSSAGKQIRSQLRELEAVSVVNIKAKFDGKDAIKQVTTYKDALGRLVETQKIFNSQMKQLKTEEITKTRADGIRNLTKETETNVSATGRLITRTKEYKDGVLQCVNVTQQYRDAQGQLVTQTQKLDASGNKLGATQKQIVNDTRTVTTEINKYIDAQGREITQTTKLNAQRDGEVERIIKARTAEGGLITTTEKLRVVQGQEVEATREETQVIERNTQVTKDNANSKKSLGDSFRNQIGAINDFVSTMGKVIKFQIITKIITGFTNACRESINVVKEFDSALTEFKKVSDLSGTALDSYTQKLGELGEAVARTRKHLLCENV